jgi:hypothetical protein
MVPFGGPSENGSDGRYVGCPHFVASGCADATAAGARAEWNRRTPDLSLEAEQRGRERGRIEGLHEFLAGAWELGFGANEELRGRVQVCLTVARELLGEAIDPAPTPATGDGTGVPDDGRVCGHGYDSGAFCSMPMDGHQHVRHEGKECLFYDPGGTAVYAATPAPPSTGGLLGEMAEVLRTIAKQTEPLFVARLGFYRCPVCQFSDGRCKPLCPARVAREAIARYDALPATQERSAEVDVLAETPANIERVAAYFDRYINGPWPDSCGPAVALLRELRESALGGEAPSGSDGAAPRSPPSTPAGEGQEAGTIREHDPTTCPVCLSGKDQM